MKLSRIGLTLGSFVLLASTLGAATNTYVFRNTKNHDELLGYIDTDVGEWGQGILVLDGYRLRTSGFDSWEYTWLAEHDGAHMCLLIHPTQPWVVGFVVWWGDWGVLDILSTDGVRFEGEVNVTCLTERPQNDAH
ncbi:MAG: hypothetical protein U1E76_22860 [Planctomycetota bacterium]